MAPEASPGKVGAAYDTVTQSLIDRLEAMIWIRRNQVSRRNLSDDQRAMNAACLSELESEKARRERGKVAVEARELHPVKKPILSAGAADKIAPPKPMKAKKAKTDTRKSASKSAGVSERKVRQAQEVKRAAPVLAAKVQAGELSLASATREIGVLPA